MKIGILIPDKKDRPIFLSKCLQYISRQSHQDFVLRIVDDEPPEYLKDKVDIAYRYQLGFYDLFKNQQCDVVMCMENDDWYSSHYIRIMLREWENAGKPDIFGLESSIYYHLSGNYSIFHHSGRSSMNTTMVTKRILSHKFDYSNPYLDSDIWTSRYLNRIGLIKKTVKLNEVICIGIKHGRTLIGGAGHNSDWTRYTTKDPEMKQLSTWIGQDAAFYRIMAVRDNYDITKRTQGKNKPYLSIVTRKHGDKRPKGFSENQNSVKAMSGSLEQVFITDKKGLGVGMANHSFQLSVPYVEGKWVYFLDDDDHMVYDNLIHELKEIDRVHNPDVIICKMIILNGKFNNTYPSPECWDKKRPIKAHIGTGCFIVKSEIFRKFIHHFGVNRCGDFNYINEIFQHNPKVYWWDKIISRTGRVSHGAIEK